MSTVLFFGYGANRSKSKITQIIKKDPINAIGGIIEGYNLCTQNLDKIPEVVRRMLKTLYGSEFKAYTLRKGEGIVSGIIWELNQEDLDLIKEWEFVGVWRELIEVTVKTSTMQTVKVITEKVPDNYAIDDIIDGLLYNEFSFINIEEDNNLRVKQYYTDQQIDLIRQWLKSQTKNGNK